ncbi:hypothetical protein OAJ57_03645 [Alphaproteobacteria bacterium]|nr:hypothetical protein [Alphaproteobacteria bacterium]
MKLARRHTEPGKSPYDGGCFPVGAAYDGVAAAFTISENLGCFRGCRLTAINFPAHWSASAREICLEQCFVHDGIASNLIAVAEEDVPNWLWRHQPDDTAKEFGGETSINAVIDRMGGGWTYQGWKGGYFDSDDDAQTFYDEIRWLLFHQKISPAIRQWQNIGRYWAYGHNISAPSTYVTDYRNGIVRCAEQTDLPPFGQVINSTDGFLAGESGIWNLWSREGDILSLRGNCGANLSKFPPAQSPGAVTGFADILDIGDTMARSACPDVIKRPIKRRLTIDEGHPDSEYVASRPVKKLAEIEANRAGALLAKRHVQAIVDAYTNSEPSQSGKRPPNAGLQMALQSARRANLPEALIERTLKLTETALARAPVDYIGNGYLNSAEDVQSSGGAVTIVRLAGEPTEETGSNDGGIDRLFDSVMFNAWVGIESGLHFQSATEAWNTCRHSGPIRSASGDGSFMFLDDTASELWMINAATFMELSGDFDVAGYQHAVELVTITADLSLMTSAAYSPRLARRVWDFRPLSISLTGLGQSLVAAGVSYDSSGGRALCASLGALLTSTAYCVSARMAAELGRFPEYKKNAADMLRVLDQHSDMVADCAQESSPPGLVEAIEKAWSEALRIGAQEGFRNAQVSVLCEAKDLATLMSSQTPGLNPISSLITRRRTQAGFYEKQINLVVPQGLRALGYEEKQIDAIIRHIAGHRTLANAPGVNHETLRKRGFTKSAIDAVEIALWCADDLSMTFTPWVLGEDYCHHMLGFTSAELNDDDFDMLAALGFSDAGIEAANIFCCGAGTMEGAPHLAPEHLAIFDCVEPQGARGSRYVKTTDIVNMMASIQPHISGGIGQALLVTPNAQLGEYRAILSLAWQLNLKSITIQRRHPNQTAIQPASRVTDVADQAQPTFTVIQGGYSPAISAVEITEDAEASVPSTSHSRIDVAHNSNSTTDVAEASRRAFSHAARSTVSVPSSADAVVEQRHV